MRAATVLLESKLSLVTEKLAITVRRVPKKGDTKARQSGQGWHIFARRYVWCCGEQNSANE